ncbi:MAG: PAS domain-containing protein [Rhodospirillaceae bacterium]
MDPSEAVLIIPNAWAVIVGFLLTAAAGVLIAVLIQRRRLTRRFTDLLADRALAEDVSGLGTWSRPIAADVSRWSPGMYRLFGLDPATFTPTRANIAPHVHPHDLPALKRIADPAVTDGAGGDAEIRIFYAGGGMKDVLAVSRFRRNRAGAVTEQFGIIIDITSRKAAQRMLALGEKQLQLAMSAMGAAVWEVDLPTNTRTAGDHWVEILGRDPKTFELTLERHDELTHPDDRDFVHERYRRHIVEGAALDIEYRMRHANGKYIWLHSRGLLLRDGSGRGVKIIGTVVEVTARREAAARLEKRAREATLLHEGVKLMAESASLPAALRALIDMVCHAIGWPIGHVFMVQPNTSELQSTDIWHDHDPARYAALSAINAGMKFAPGVGLPGNVWMTGRPIWVADIVVDSQFAHLRDFSGLHGAVAFPITVRGETRAIVEFFSDRIQDEDADLLRVLESLGRQIGGVIERQESAENLMRQAREQYLLHAGMTLAADAPSFESVIQRTLDMVCETIGWPVGHAYVLADPAAEELAPTHIWHLDDTEAHRAFRDATARTRLRRGQGLPGRVWESQRPTWIEDLTKDANFPRGKILAAPSLRAAICMPVQVGGTFRAVLEFFAEDVTPRDMDLLRVFGTLGLQLGSVVERQEAYEELRRSRESLELAIQASDAGHFDIDAKTGKAYWSPRVREMFGITSPDFRLTPEVLARFVHPDDQPEFLADLEEYRMRNTPLNAEVRIVRPSGEPIWLHIRAVRQLDKFGQPLRSIGFVRDISVQKSAQRALAESERKVRNRIEGSIQGLVIHRRYKPLFCNLAFARQLGYQLVDDVLALDSLASHRVPEDTFDVDDLWRRGLAGEFDGKLREVAIIDRDGRRKWLETLWQMIDWEGGIACQMIVMDVTERIEREKELAAARDRLTRQADELAALAQNLQFESDRAEDASTAKSQFLAMMSHELRTPMTGVLGMADLLMMSGQTEEQKELTQLLIRSARALLDLLNDILDFSKIEAGQLEIESTPFRLGDVISDVKTLFGSVASEKGLTLETRLPPTYWNTVIGDPKRLRQVLSNLVANAVKFTAKGTIVLTLKQERIEGGGLWLRFAIADTGIGMSQDDIERLFKPFVQADVSTARKYGGTGLGLAICKRLVLAMEGEIGVESTPGKGSVFSFAVRVGHDRLGEAAAPVALPERPDPVAPAAAAVPRRILLAEDSETSRRLISMMLIRLGHTVAIANDGAEAVALAKTNTYDVVLMDMQMPVMDGPDATREIRKMGGACANLPVIALTADVIADNRATYFAAGINAIVAKPVDWNQLDAEMTRQIAAAGERVGAGGGKGRAPKPVTQKAGFKETGAGSAANAPVQPIILDEDMIKSLIDALGEDVFAPMITTFRNNMVQYRDDLAAAVTAGDLRKAKRTAHALKGLCAQFGAPRASSLAKFIEVDSKSLAEIEAVLAQVAETVVATEQALAARFPGKI